MKKMMTGVLALVMVLVMVGCGQKDNGVVNGVAKDGATIGALYRPSGGPGADAGRSG